ncbi:MAG: hypothetical protein U9Q85_00255 [Patescibacteria group bacterium]|nr:hypothetical protein [Patescibacteria group bacterium]
MKKIKIKLNQKIIFKYIYIVFIFSNLVLVFYLYNFFNKNVYNAIMHDQNLIEAQARQSMEQLDINKFNKLIKAVADKKNH